MDCRFCQTPLEHVFVDLGVSPLCQTVVRMENANAMEPFYPLKAWVCSQCFLVQLDEYVAPSDIFSEYAYFSSYSTSWVEHARRYAVGMIDRLKLGRESLVVEIASNDGYLLQHFVAADVPVLGVEPAANVAKVAVERGVRTTVQFFGRETAASIGREHGCANLLLGNNVLAHVPDINDFVGGMKALLAPNGVITMEFPHLLRLMDESQFDTIYHEHFSYLSLTTVRRIFSSHGLTVFDVDELPTHGGSLRIYAKHTDDTSKPETSALAGVLETESRRGFSTLEAYFGFGQRVAECKRDILTFLIAAKRAGKSVVGYGAPGKGNTLLNYCGIRTDFLDYTVDRNPYKQGTLAPGSRIPIHAPELIRETRPDYVFVLPWNLKDEIVEQTNYIREWGGKWVVPIPRVEIID